MDLSKTTKGTVTVHHKKPSDTDVVTAELKKGFVWTTQHSYLVGGFIAAFIVIGGGITGWKMWSESKEKDLQAKYYDIEVQVNKKRADFEKAKTPAPPAEKDKPETKAPVAATGDLGKDYGDLPGQLKSFVEKYPASAAGNMAALTLASLQAEYNQTAEALQTLKLAQPPKNFVGSLVKMELATQLANNGQCPEATAIWTDLVGQESAKFLKGEAKLKLALCAETQGDKAKAQSLYKEVETEFKDTAAGRSASQYLRLLAVAPTGEKKNSN